MSVPPFIVDVRVVGAGRRRFRLWIPAFLLWPLLLAIGVVALMAAIAVDAVLVASGRRYHRYSALLVGSLRAVNETRGLKIYVTDDTTTIDIDVR